MGKRKNRVEDEEHIKKKIRKLKKRLQKTKEESVNLDSDDTPSPPRPQSHHQSILPSQDDEPGPSRISMDIEPEPKLDEDIIPEEFLVALGNEGEDIKEVGEPIRSELALRWSRIMSTGLGKEAKEQIVKEYPTPENFCHAIAPAMNPEILSSLSELTVKRDRRVMARQNTIGKMMSCMGKALTSLLKGNINSKVLIEEINDAAKLAADVFHQDSTSRKFFALAGANQTVKEAVRHEQSDELLFGKNCADKIKAAQAIQKTGLQIKNSHLLAKAPSKPLQTQSKKPGNWKGPPQQQQHRRGRGGHHQTPRRPYSQPHFYQKDPKQQTRSRTNYRR